MSAMRDRYETLIDEIKAETAKLKAEVRTLFGHADPAVEAVAKTVTDSAVKVGAAIAEIQADAPAIEAEAKADAEKVEADAVAAEKPVAEEAVEDGEHLAGEVAKDVEGAVRFDPPTSATPPAKAAN